MADATTDPNATAVTQTGTNLPSLITWNPPPHTLTRPRPTSWSDAGSGTTDQEKVRLGGIFTVKNNFTVDTYASAGFGNFKKSRYGMQFCYNPTSIGYQSTVDPNVSPETMSTGKILGSGMVNVSIDLYLNRIFDLQAGVKAGDYLNGSQPIKKEDIDGITRRGTEYDLEFLWRALNGDPVNVTHTGFPTADWGMLMQTYVTLVLGQYWRYDGFITGVSVNHILFTSEMVPTFTQVTLGFTRLVTAEVTAKAGSSSSSSKSTGSSGSTSAGEHSGSRIGSVSEAPPIWYGNWQPPQWGGLG